MLVPALLGVLMVCRVQVSTNTILARIEEQKRQSRGQWQSIAMDNFFSANLDDNFYFFYPLGEQAANVTRNAHHDRCSGHGVLVP